MVRAPAEAITAITIDMAPACHQWGYGVAQESRTLHQIGIFQITHEEAGKSGLFLLSDMSSGITGEILHLDGGYNAMGSPGRLLDQIKAAQTA